MKDWFKRFSRLVPAAILFVTLFTAMGDLNVNPTYNENHLLGDLQLNPTYSENHLLGDLQLNPTYSENTNFWSG